LPLEVFAVEALGVLLSPDVCDLLAKEALVVGSMSSIIMWAPELEVGVISSGLINVFASWLVECSEVKRDHNVLTSISFACNVAFSFFIAVVIRAVDHELLSCALWLDDDVIDEDWLFRDLKLGPSLALVP
jgi:hypothetical protein